MNTASLKEIKAELETLHPKQVRELCLRLARYKKENKEMLSYLLFEAGDENIYLKAVIKEVDEAFKDLNTSAVYLSKKTLRKILRIINKHIKFSGSKIVEVEVLLHFCKKMKSSGLPLHANTVIGNMYMRQVQRIRKALASMHEDLQYDYSREISRL